MPLDKQPVSIDFSDGLDTKTDDKLTVPAKLIELENGTFSKLRAITKRGGSTKLSNDIFNSSSHVSLGKALADYNNELHLVDGSNIYSYLESQTSWINKGNLFSCGITKSDIINSSKYHEEPQIASNGNVTVIAWCESDSNTATAYTAIKCNVIDETTGTNILFNCEISTSAYVRNLRLCSMGNYIYVLYIDGGTPAIKYRRIDITSPISFASATTLKTPAGLLSFEIFKTVISGTEYCTIAHSAAATIKVFYMNASGVEVTSPAEVTVTVNNDYLNKVYVLSYSSHYYIFVFYYDYTGAGGLGCFCLLEDLTSVFAPAIFDSDVNMPVYRLTAINTDTGNSLTFIYEKSGISSALKTTSYVVKNTIDITGSAGTPATIMNSVVLASEMKTIYGNKCVIVQYSDDNIRTGLTYSVGNVYQQPTYYLIKDDGSILTKIASLHAGIRNVSWITSDLTGLVLKSTGIYNCALTELGSLINQNGVIFSNNGIVKYTLDFITNNLYDSAKLGKNLFLSGGSLQEYDGVSVFESGYNVYPTINDFSTIIGLITTYPKGSPVVKESRTVVICSDYIYHGQYFTLYSAGDATKYKVWYGFGASYDALFTPTTTGSWTLIKVSIDPSYYNNKTIIDATVTAINAAASADFTAVESYATGEVSITNTATGVATNSQWAKDTTGTAFTAAIYQHVAIYTWIDNNNQIHRSSPSNVLVTDLTTDSADSFQLAIHCNRLTLRKSPRDNISIELYRTAGNGSVFYRCATIANDVTKNSVVCVDKLSDTDLQKNEMLYTTGGIIENIVPLNGSIIETHQNRLFVSGTEDPTLIQYSKEFSLGESIGFNETFEIRVDPFGGEITALASLDDKLLIFKKNVVYFTAGDGLNAMAQGQNFIMPQLIMSDVGCTDPNSVALMPTGIMFKSAKGIYIVERNLAVKYIGADVEAYNSYVITSAQLCDKLNQVRFTTNNYYTLVFDYYTNRWSTFYAQSMIDSIVHNGDYYMLNESGIVYKEDITIYKDDSVKYTLKAKTSWIKLNAVQGYQRIYKALFIGKFDANHSIVVQVAYDYDPTIIDTFTYTQTDSSTLWQFLVGLKKQKCESIQFTIYDTPTGSNGNSLEISNITLLVGLKKGTYKIKASRRV